MTFSLAGVGRIPLRGRDGSPRAWATVDLADFHDVARYRWSLTSKGYAQRRAGGTIELLHRRMLGLRRGDGRQGDHRDRDKLNHRRENLRIVPGNAANRQNLDSYRGAVSSYRGVDWHKACGKWRARAKIGGCEVHLGLYDDEAEAGRAAAAFREAHMPYSELGTAR